MVKRAILALVLLLSPMAFVGTADASPMRVVTAPAVAQKVTCKSGYYKNVSGKCIPRPKPAPKPPKGATARCKDGTYSFSQHRRGTCSGHKGVAAWL